MSEITSFTNEDAAKYGLLEAIILWNIRGFLKWAKTNNKNVHNGRYWTYNSIKAFQVQIPFASVKQIERALSKLRKAGVLLHGCFNKHKYDRTSWYSINDDAYITPNREMVNTERVNDNPQKDEPIPKSSTKLNTEVVVVENNVTTSIKNEHKKQSTTSSSDFKIIKDYIISTPYYERLKAYKWIDKICSHFGSLKLFQASYNKLYSSYMSRKPFNTNWSDEDSENWHKDLYSFIENALIKEITR